MPCVVAGPKGTLKTVKLVGTNLQQHVVHDKITVGKAFCLNPTDNFIEATFDACLLSSARTAACAALAKRYLDPRGHRVLVIGAGRIGYYIGLYCLAWSGLSRLTFADQTFARAEAVVAAFVNAGPQSSVALAVAPMTALPDADVVILATTSTVSVLDPATPGRLIISVGADTRHQHELPKEWARDSAIYCDTRDSCQVGDLKTWIDEGIVSLSQITDMSELLTHPPAVGAIDIRRIFVTTGWALFDNLTIAYLLGRELF
jgi:ornithine cyclodeaminase/alanine dehydrogenase-like protein (mu-crystallin family)